MKKSILNTKKLVVLAVLSALGSVLMVFEIPFIPPLKIDISDVTVTVAGIIYGPFGAVVVAAIKSLVHIFVTPDDFGVGEFIAFVASMCYVLPFLFTVKLSKKVFTNQYLIRIVPGIVATISLTVLITIFNIAVSFQLYSFVMTNKFLSYNTVVAMAISFIPGNLIKGAVISVIFLILSFRLDYVVEKLKIYDEDKSQFPFNK